LPNLENDLDKILNNMELEFTGRNESAQCYQITRKSTKNKEKEPEDILAILGVHKKDRLLIYGAGEFAQKLLLFIDNYNIVGLLDSKENKWNTLLNGYRIYPPGEILKLEPEAVLVGSVIYGKEIVKMLGDIKSAANADFQIINLFEDIDDETAGTIWIRLYGEGVGME